MKKARVLIIDDEEDLLSLLRIVMEREGYEVVLAKNGKEGIRAYREQSFDLVVTDLVMPEKEGLETIIDLRRINPKVKVIAMSGGIRATTGTYLHIAKNLGAELALEKPFENHEFLAAVKDVLARPVE